MTAIYKQRGDAVDYIPEQDTPAGSVIIQGDLVGITKLDIPAGQRGAIALTGIFTIPKAEGVDTAIEAGTKLYWHAGSKIVVTSPDDGSPQSEVYPYLGKAIAAAEDDDPTVQLKLCP